MNNPILGIYFYSAEEAEKKAEQMTIQSNVQFCVVREREGYLVVSLKIAEEKFPGLRL